ncbi:MAG: hypothetical protein C4547_04230 [Phycisphaerales bacterium]|nr:MAG: hypothetical protein C4547_04230 [Phycisphaerales bacterium]
MASGRLWAARPVLWAVAVALLAGRAAYGEVTLLWPNGAEVLQAGSEVEIRWVLDVPRPQHDWDLWYSLTGPAGPWIEVVMDLPSGSPEPGSVHTFRWTVPDTASSHVRVRVRQDLTAYGDLYDISDADLRLRPAPVVGDVDDDYDVDLDDYRLAAACMAGPGVKAPPQGCTPTEFEAADGDGDRDVDLADLSRLFAGFTGPPADVAVYLLTFDSTWSRETHPIDFPANPHFSGLIGGTHHDAAVFWREGERASLGIKNMAELGSKTALTREVEAQIVLGRALEVVSGPGISRSPGRASVALNVTQEFPLATVVSMIAPSPDWFVGVAGFPLFQDNRWLEEIAIPLQPYDAGTDSGVTYSSPNQVTDPPEPIYEIFTVPFADDGTVPPLGTFRFTRQPE